jgi:hypothetical protein
MTIPSSADRGGTGGIELTLEQCVLIVFTIYTAKGKSTRSISSLLSYKSMLQ